MGKVVWNFLWLPTCWVLFTVVETNIAYLSSNDDDFYTAAVVEFSLTTTPNIATAKPKRMIETSLNEYLRLINEASENGADIIVFPEGSLNYNGIGTRKNLIKYAVELEEADIYNSTSFDNVCDYSKKSSTSSSILSKISFNAKNNRIYVLINVIERSGCSTTNSSKEGCSVYSSNLVFDRSGCIISRYRKFNTKIDPMLDSTSLPEVQVFHTDFDVTFGHFTSLDILTKYPAYIMLQHGIQHVLYPTSWFSSLPFYTSLQIQQSYSYANNIVMLASSANSPISGQGGSGIFVGRSGAVAMILPAESTQQLILSRIPKDIETYSVHTSDNVVKRYSSKQMDELFITQIPVLYTESLPTSKWDVRRLCKDKICCEFSMRQLQYEAKKDKLRYFYKLTAFSGREKYIDEKSKELYCAVVSCTSTSDSSSTCGKRFQPSDDVMPSVKFQEIKIKMIVELEATQNDYLVMPSNVDFSILPLDTSQFIFERSSVYSQNEKLYINYTSVLTEDNEELLTFGILGRVFHLDEFEDNNYDVEAPALIYLLLSLVVGVLTMILMVKLFRF